MSYYLKYRPQTIAQLDLDSVRLELSKILTSGRFSQAYLFTGPKGTGKTSSARILAKLLNCEKNKNQVVSYKQQETGRKQEELFEPCGTCESCRAIAAGSSLAVLEMDGASNRGIDDIRVLRERVSLAPVQGEMTVYVVDEVHMLTTEAFNALLKTLEEPPAHVVFALCTTEAHKVPDTIESRCTAVHFVKANASEVKRSLDKAVKGENLTIDEAGLMAISKRVDGSFRDGMKLLEQLSMKSGNISAADVDELTGYGIEYQVDDFISALLAKDVLAGLGLIAGREQKGVEFGLWGKRIVEQLRKMLLEVVTQSGADQEKIRELQGLSELFLKAVAEMKTAVVIQLPLELAVVEWGLGGESSKFYASRRADKIQNSKLREKIKNSADVASNTTLVDTHSLGTNLKIKAQNLIPDEVAEVVETQVSDGNDLADLTPLEVSQSRETKTRDSKPSDLEMVTVRQAWPQIMKAVKPLNHSLEALLRAVEPDRCEERVLVLRVFYNFHKEQLEQQRHRSTLENVFAQELGSPLKLEFEIGKKIRRSTDGVENRDVEDVTGKVEDESLAEAAEEIFGN